MRGRKALVLTLVVALLAGCASLRGSRSPTPGERHDPWESWNRGVFAFNEAFDNRLFRPVATVYNNVVPGPVRRGADNFFSNVGDAWSAVNLLLQGRFTQAVQQTMRFAVNTGLGFAGVLDIATEVGLERSKEDLGRTFSHWGFGPGAYVVWPLFGPSSVRDSLALPFDLKMKSSTQMFTGLGSKTTIFVAQQVNARANYLRAGEMLDGIALDKYTFVRDAYLQRREQRGNRPSDDDEGIEIITGNGPAASAPAPAEVPSSGSAPAVVPVASASAASPPAAAASAPVGTPRSALPLFPVDASASASAETPVRAL